MDNSTVCKSKWKQIVDPRRVKLKTYRQAPTHWSKFYEEAVIESEARTAVVQLKRRSHPQYVLTSLGRNKMISRRKNTGSQTSFTHAKPQH